MAAGMADAGQRIVFGEDRNCRAARLAELRDIRGLEPEGFAADGDVVAGDRIAKARSSLELFQRQLGLAMNGVAQRQ